MNLYYTFIGISHSIKSIIDWMFNASICDSLVNTITRLLRMVVHIRLKLLTTTINPVWLKPVQLPSEYG